MVMVRDAEATKARLLEAATAEFAAYGIAGARIDRIAAAAAVNKQMIYAYFGSKDALFDVVFSTYVGGSLSKVDFDASDLPEYAGRMYDRFANDPASLRLSTWYRLERPQGRGLEAVVAINEARLERLREAQRAGALSGHFDAVELLSLIQAIATSWATMNPEFTQAAEPIDHARRRRAVVDAVRGLLAETK
jgi:AcrR family transcriptional regulator